MRQQRRFPAPTKNPRRRKAQAALPRVPPGTASATGHSGCRRAQRVPPGTASAAGHCECRKAHFELSCRFCIFHHRSFVLFFYFISFHFTSSYPIISIISSLAASHYADRQPVPEKPGKWASSAADFAFWAFLTAVRGNFDLDGPFFQRKRKSK